MINKYGFVGAESDTHPPKLRSIHETIKYASGHAKKRPNMTFYVYEATLVIRNVNGQIRIEEIAEVE